jgi:L-asparaginase/Glu-tRNA(Gln) amidotransferase subunit D
VGWDKQLPAQSLVNWLEIQFHNHVLSTIRILFTGGTIAGGSIYGGLDDTQYGQLQITGEAIIARDPLLHYGNVSSSQPMSHVSSAAFAQDQLKVGSAST